MIIFKDFNFKLHIIDHFIGAGIFDKELNELQRKYWDNNNDFSYEPIPEIKRFFEELEITNEMLSAITSFCPDGGDNIYGIIIANWVGEDEIFDIQSLEDVAVLPNLFEFSPVALVVENIDLSPLLGCMNLKKMSFLDFTMDRALPFLQKGVVVNNYFGSEFVTMNLVKLSAVAPLFPEDCWVTVRNKVNKGELDNETILHVRGNWNSGTIDLDNVFNQDGDRSSNQYVFAILVEGNLRANNIFNRDTDGGTGLLVIGNLSVDNMVVGGQEIYVTKKLTVKECFWGEYNHGSLVIKKKTKAKVFVATNEYGCNLKKVSSTIFLSDSDTKEDTIEYDIKSIKNVFKSKVINANEASEEEVFSWENFLDRDEMIELLKKEESIINDVIEAVSIVNLREEALKEVETIFKNKTFSNQTEFENQWRNFDKIIEFSVQQKETDSFEWGQYEGYIVKKSSKNKMTFISVDFPEGFSFFIQKKETEPLGFLEKLKLKSSTFYLFAMYRNHPDASYEYVYENINQTPIEIIERLQVFWNELLERAEKAIHFFNLFKDTVRLKNIQEYLKYPVIQHKYNDYWDNDKHGFWGGKYFFKFNRERQRQESGVVAIGKERKSSDEFDIRVYYVKLNKAANPSALSLYYCSSQSGFATDRFSEFSKIVPFLDWEKYFEFLQWYPKLDKYLNIENNDFLEEEENLKGSIAIREGYAKQEFTKPLENVQFCGINFKIVTRQEAEMWIGNLTDFGRNPIYDVHHMNSLDYDLESRLEGFFLLAENQCQTDVFEMDVTIEGVENLIILGFIFMENISITKCLMAYDDDFSPPFIALKNLTVTNAYFCGDKHYIGGDLVCDIVYGFYNHGELIVKGNTTAAVIMAADCKMYLGGIAAVNAIIDPDKKNVYYEVLIENEDGSTEKRMANQMPTHNYEDLFLDNFIYLDGDYGYKINDETFFDSFRKAESLFDVPKFINCFGDFQTTLPDRVKALFETESLNNLAVGMTHYEDYFSDTRYYCYTKGDDFLQVGFWNTDYHYMMHINLFLDGSSQFVTNYYETDDSTLKFLITTNLNENTLNTFAVRKMFCDAEKIMLDKF
ncbi:hypothetical protein FNW52_11480 [Flavobacterium sp. ZT3R18]|uniref:DUF6892 domain-containing protein n=1 Tax=Flavobacterium sp. ZT3R18 TaxID=2594429 RepID=UPI00117A8893|nr:hypothetical protein [Flavobacterium sp. ZT3R18]TRX35334.1 hypothetical protein FNW52_11480 [Flavobacterium sp. ZT3R18]